MNLLSLSLRGKGAARALGISLAAFHELQNPKSPRFDPRFPAKIHLGPRSVVYSLADLQAYLEICKASTQPSKGGEQ